MTDTPLFGILADDPAPLPPDERALLRSLPVWPETNEITWEQRPIANALSRRGLIKIERWKSRDDPEMTVHAGRLP